MDYVLLVIGFIFTFFIPGFYILETFFPVLPARIKIPLVPILSVIVSTYLVYLISLIVGFSKYSILISFSFFIPWVIVDFGKIVTSIKKFLRNHLWGLMISLIVFAIFFTSLFPGIFTLHDGYIVMSSSNWQDTAMHAGIIETISQGNFPPQAPYFAGKPLSYYYFADFHTSILETLFGRFFPRILVYDNPLFSMSLALAVYALAFELTRDKKVSIFSAILSPFIGNYMFINFLKDWFGKLGTASWLIGNRGYAIEFGGLFQISPMSDYFLQNRPMMVGIPSAVLVFLLSIYLFRKRQPEIAILAGLLAGSLIKFQLFASLVCLGLFFLTAVCYFSLKRFKFIGKTILFFSLSYSLPFLIFVSTTNINDGSLFKVFIENLFFGPWEDGKNIFWFLQFIFFNLGFPFIITIFAILKKGISRNFLLIILATLVLVLIPFTMKFTIMKYDMLKFFYFSSIFSTIVTFWIIKRYKLLVLIIILTSSFTSFLNLGNSFLNKTMAYTIPEVDSGYWIRENTPKLSTFIDLANVHSPITEVGGRLRVLSYINWPHSHGYNVGVDNVFSRLEDINRLYRSADLTVLNKYNAAYIYYGNTERNSFPDAQILFESSEDLTKVYDNGEVVIYKKV